MSTRNLWAFAVLSALLGVGRCQWGMKLKQVSFISTLLPKALDGPVILLPSLTLVIYQPALSFLLLWLYGLPQPENGVIFWSEKNGLYMSMNFSQFVFYMVETLYTVAFKVYAFKLKSLVLRIQTHWLLKIKCIFCFIFYCVKIYVI